MLYNMRAPPLEWSKFRGYWLFIHTSLSGITITYPDMISSELKEKRDDASKISDTWHAVSDGRLRFSRNLHDNGQICRRPPRGFHITAISLFFALLLFVPLAGSRIVESIQGASARDWVSLFLQALFGIMLFRVFLLLGLQHTTAAEAGILTGTSRRSPLSCRGCC